MSEIRFLGTNRLRSALRERTSLDEVKQIVQMNGAELNRTAQTKAPVDTGFLRRSIVFSLANDGMTAISKAGAEYAPYLEKGTRYMVAQPFMKPAYNLQKEKFISDLERLIQ